MLYNTVGLYLARRERLNVFRARIRRVRMHEVHKTAKERGPAAAGSISKI